MTLLYCIIRDIDPTRANSGSAVRPIMLRDAFEEVADKLCVVAGNSASRKAIWENINYSDFDGVYCELNTLPIAISDADHFPRHPLTDLASLKKIHEHGIPVAAYYRDIHWRYPGLVSGRLNPSTYLLMILHYLELRKLKGCLDHLFVPSMTMLDRIPTRFPRTRVSTLPPGATIRDYTIEGSGQLRLLYTGGVLPPLYDIRPMLTAVAGTADVRLTICCRQREWERAKTLYNIPNNVAVVHTSGEGLDMLYRTADAFMMYWAIDPSNYLQFSMPVKLFEAVGAGLPVITNKRTEMGNFVDQNGLGWTFTNEFQLQDFLRSSSQDMQSVRAKRATVREQRWNHTWNARAHEIIRVLSSYAQ